MLYGARIVDLKRLQRLQNKAARLVFGCGRDQPSGSLLTDLHWLPVKERICFKMFTLIYKILHAQAPSYLVNLIHLQIGISDAHSHRLSSSSDLTRLSIPRSKRKAGDTAFSVAAPRSWNIRPTSLREAASLAVFKRLLKTFLFPEPS